MPRQSESIANLAVALVKAQSQIEPPRKESTNTYRGWKYADLTAVWEACRKPLQDNGLAVVQTARVPEFHPRTIHAKEGDETVFDAPGVILETTLMHTSGEWITGELYMPATDATLERHGAAVGYARRIALLALLGIAPVDDDEGESFGQSGNGRSADHKGSKALSLDIAVGDMDAITDLKSLLSYWNKFSKDINASPDKAEIVKHFQARRKTLEGARK